MAYTKKTLQEIITEMLNDLKTAVESSYTFLRRSVFDILTKVFGAAIYMLYDYLTYIKNQMFIISADEESLERHGAEYGMPRNHGTKAIGSALASGTVGLSISSGSELLSEVGNSYYVTSSYTVGISGTETISFQAAEVGTKYNESAGTVLTFANPISGITSTVLVLSSGIINGEDEETPEEYRQRILERKRKPPHGGADFDYIKWSLDYSNVTRAWSIPEYYGIGTIGVVAVNDEPTRSSIFLSVSERASYKSWLQSHTDPTSGKTVGVPVTANPGLFIIDAQPNSLNMTIGIEPNSESIQDAITSKLRDLILEQGAPDNSISISNMYAAISSAIGEQKSKIYYPSNDFVSTASQVPVLGTITYTDYI